MAFSLNINQVKTFQPNDIQGWWGSKQGPKLLDNHFIDCTTT
jgi:hypothetical protein